MTGVLIKEGIQREKATGRVGQRLEVCSYKRAASRSWEGTGRSSLEPLVIAWPCHTLILGFWHPELGENTITVVLIHLICCTLLQQPQDTNVHCPVSLGKA